MIPLSTILQLKFPGIDLFNEVQLGDQGDGKVFIAQWTRSEPIPTEEDIKRWRKELKKIHKDQCVRELREQEYPPIRDLVIALWEKEVLNDTIKIKALQEKRIKVKNKYPKLEK